MRKIITFFLLVAVFLIKSNSSFGQIPTYAISQVKLIDTAGTADSLNVNCKLIGVVNSINYTTTSLQFYILDQTNGIYVFKSSAIAGFTVNRGDSIRVIGKIAQVNGMIEMVPDSIVVLASGSVQQSPLLISQLNNDSLESRLVKMDNLHYISGWTSGNNTRTVLVSRGVDTITYRFSTTANIRNVAAPTSTVTFSLAGFVNQSASTTAPFVGGYRIYPRDSFDLVINYTNPVLYTNGTTTITPNFAVCNGNITTDGGHIITSRGFCYDTLANPDTSKSKVIVTGTTGAFSGNLSGLLSSKTYHYRSFAINSAGVFYGNDTVFTTTAAPILPIVTTNAATRVTYYSAVLSGTIVNNGGDTILSKGVCWSTNPTPTIADSIRYDYATTATYSDTITTLSQVTTYYARAFAVSAVGVGYGSIVTFTTIKLPPLATIAQARSTNSSGVADSLTVNLRVVGTVHSINYGSASTLAFYICDSTTGIYVYRTGGALGYTATRGDKIRVAGRIAQVNGLIEIVADSLVVLSSGNTLNTPLVVSSLNDTLESRLVKMNKLVYLSGWPVTASTTTATVRTLLNGTDTITIMVSRYCYSLQGKPAPTDTFSVIGMVSQNDNSVPYTSGYTIYPRDSMDIIITGTTAINESSAKIAYSIYPNPSNGNININIRFDKKIAADVKIFSMLGAIIVEKTMDTSSATFDISKFGKGVYFIEIIDRKSGLGSTEKIVVQ